MKSKVQGNNYIYQFDGDRYPEKVNRKKADKMLKRIADALKTIKDEASAAYENDSSLYNLIENYIFSGFDFDEGQCYRLDEALDSVTGLQEIFATNNDEILLPEEIDTLRDLGYKKHFSHGFFFEKIIEDTEDKEVVDEIQMTKDGPIRRLRTIEYEKTDHGRSSTSIKYKKLPIGKRLMKAIENSLKPVDEE